METKFRAYLKKEKRFIYPEVIDFNCGDVCE